jgi:2-polyprenyl-3-methyl-5-hydroxy-6-metoxy-1,4-benzoquinol methylase
MNCYLCGSPSSTVRKGEVRDAPEIRILECDKCGLVYLNRTDQIKSNFYEDSGMHGANPIGIADWMRATEQDDQRRFETLRQEILGKKILDFGCGAGGFLVKAKKNAAYVAGIELEKRVHQYWGDGLKLFYSPQDVDKEYDLITAFHVIEHLLDPRAMLKELARHLAPGGKIIVEVPNSNDALLSLYECDAFQKFTYWSQHLYLFNEDNLRELGIQAGLKVLKIDQVQRYPLSNHMYWLRNGRPGGQDKWGFMNNAQLHKAYSDALSSLNACDTIVGQFSLVEN